MSVEKLGCNWGCIEMCAESCGYREPFPLCNECIRRCSIWMCRCDPCPERF